MRVQTFAALGVALAVSTAAPVSAAPRKAVTPPAEAAAHRARAHFDRGVRLYKQARYRDAIAEFEAAYKDRPHGVIFFNIAQSYEKLGEIAQALKAYHQYLRALPNADDRATVEVAMKNLEQRLAAKGVQQVLVYSNPDGAQVLIDGRPAGHTPYSGELGLGQHTIGLELEGYASKQRQLELTATASVVLDFTLEPVTRTDAPIAQTKQTPPPALTPEAPAAKAAGTEVVRTAPLPPPSPEAKPRVWTWIAGGVGVAALAAAVALGANAKSAESELHGSLHDRATATSLASSAQGSARASNIFYGVAGAAGAATVALFFVEGRF